MLLGVLSVPQPTRVEANGRCDAAAGEGTEATQGCRYCPQPLPTSTVDGLLQEAEAGNGPDNGSEWRLWEMAASNISICPGCRVAALPLMLHEPPGSFASR